MSTMWNAPIDPAEALMDASDAGDVTIEVGDIVCIETGAPGIAFYGRVVRLLPGCRALVVNRYVGQRRAKLDDLRLIAKAGALENAPSVQASSRAQSSAR